MFNVFWLRVVQTEKMIDYPNKRKFWCSCLPVITQVDKGQLRNFAVHTNTSAYEC
jgi:hypothetical protein